MWACNLGRNLYEAKASYLAIGAWVGVAQKATCPPRVRPASKSALRADFEAFLA